MLPFIAAGVTLVILILYAFGALLLLVGITESGKEGGRYLVSGIVSIAIALSGTVGGIVALIQALQRC